MHRIIRYAAFPTLIMIAGCTHHAPPERIGMPNPASAYCVQQGGHDEILDTPQGQIGICHLSNGRACEEWALFREHRCTLPTPQVGR
ncbi:putative hemolysin [Gluconobacter wancherniae]|uniref:putative hemolysin n=1 Tax=Gluconobacter wancherniae TaxID=1307955 RepID=UPI0011BD651B|nr:DUF333 domain-containing protein [Gluconobacter wancherniae]MBF0854572.1 DUF333 domain-containing protein [Gluconobacter wancherniae]GBD57702.1 hemolysin [Gluconobacter wancherniae NBRC 103581]